MHTLLFHQPGHFHAALLLRAPNPRVSRSIHVYATPGPELDRFAALVAGFNSRSDTPTGWNLELHMSDDPLTQLIDERRGESVVVAGPTSTKLATIRRLHDAGLNVLADKPWITSAAGIDDLVRVTDGPPVVMDIMTERHDVMSRLRRRIVATESVFGQFAVGSDGVPALEFESIHHLCKIVDGRPLRRPEWYYDVRVQGDGLVDIHSHMVDQAQWLIAETGTTTQTGMGGAEAQLDGAIRWSTPVPLSTFTESTGAAEFPPELMRFVTDDVLDVACNGEIEYRLGGVNVRQRAVWRTHEPAEGGDTHRSVVRGAGAVVTVERGADTGYRAQLHVGPADQSNLADLLSEGLEIWASEFPELRMQPSRLGYEFVVPPASETPHETVFPLALDGFLDYVEQDHWSPRLAQRIRTRYALLAKAHEEAATTTHTTTPPGTG